MKYHEKKPKLNKLINEAIDIPTRLWGYIASYSLASYLLTQTESNVKKEIYRLQAIFENNKEQLCEETNKFNKSILKEEHVLEQNDFIYLYNNYSYVFVMKILNHLSLVSDENISLYLKNIMENSNKQIILLSKKIDNINKKLVKELK